MANEYDEKQFDEVMKRGQKALESEVEKSGLAKSRLRLVPPIA
jgi:hypothetical protein